MIGAFIEHTHITENPLDWEGGNSSRRYKEMCNGATRECFVQGFLNGPSWARDLRFASYYSHSKKILAIYANNTNRERTMGMRLRIFVTEDGREINCGNCDTEELSQNEPAIGYWNGDSEFILTTAREVNDEKRDSVWQIEVQGEVYRIRLLKQITSSVDAAFHGSAQLRPDGKSLAWIVCDPDCVLVQADLISGQERTRPAQCSKNGYSTIVWIGDDAHPKCD
ncbi:MAG: hypothetical protein U1F26_18235 [Lysobacterales bacterium]